MYKSSKKTHQSVPNVQAEVARCKSSCCPNAYSAGALPDLPVPPAVVPPAVRGGAAVKHAGEGKKLWAHLVQLGHESCPPT